MDAEALRSRFAARAPGLPVEVDGEAPAHPHVAGRRAALTVRGDGGTAVVHAGAVAGEETDALAGRVAALLEERRAEDEEAAHALPREKAVFEAHARFRADREVPRGWYRRGEPLDAGLWVVDLDVFLEVVLPSEDWDELRGGVVPLVIEKERLEIEIPGDADPDECWTVPGAGLFEAEADVRLEELEPDDVVPGRFGDLHVMPVVF